MKIKAQSALEYLMIIAISLGIIIPTAFLFFKYSSDTNYLVLSSQIDQIGRSMKDTAEIVYFSGEGSKLTIEVNMPKEINNISIVGNREIVFDTVMSLGETEMVYFADVNITSQSCITNVCYLDELALQGPTKIRFHSVNNGTQVQISRV